MRKFHFQTREVVTREVVVEAQNAAEARSKAEAWANGCLPDWHMDMGQFVVCDAERVGTVTFRPVKPTDD